MKDHIFELRRKMEGISDHRSCIGIAQQAVVKLKPEKKNIRPEFHFITA